MTARRARDPLQPYQIFFPLGLLFGIWGALLWPLFVFAHLPYPGPAHAGLMAPGFLLCFAAGFLLTAVPRFTGSKPARPVELWLVFAACTAPLWAGWAAPRLSMVSHLSALCGLSTLLVFYLTRRRHGGFNVPEYFDWIGVGLAMGMAGAAILSLEDFQVIASRRHLLGTLLLDQLMMLALIVGVGGKLVAALLGWVERPLVQITRPGQREARARRTHVYVLLSIFTGSVFFDAFGVPVGGPLVRALCCSYLGVRAWRLHRLPRERGRLSTWLWISCWALVAGLWLQTFWVTGGVHALHLTLVAGISSMVILVASRVSLAHGGYDLALERDSRSIRVVVLLILAAALTRVSAPLLPSTYFRHLAYAGLVWSAAVVVWGVVFVPRILTLAKRGRSASQP